MLWFDRKSAGQTWGDDECVQTVNRFLVSGDVFQIRAFSFYFIIIFIIIFNMTQVSVTTRVFSTVCYSNPPVTGIKTLNNVCSNIADNHGMTLADWNKKRSLTHFGS